MKSTALPLQLTDWEGVMLKLALPTSTSFPTQIHPQSKTRKTRRNRRSGKPARFSIAGTPSIPPASTWLTYLWDPISELMFPSVAMVRSAPGGSPAQAAAVAVAASTARAALAAPVVQSAQEVR
jgi:hypothetical protein